WISLDIPMNDFTGLMNQENIAQLILVGQPTAATTVYVDNVYFYKDTGTSVDEFASLRDRVRVFPNPVKSGAQVQLSFPAAQIDVFDLTGKRIATLLNTSAIQTEGLMPGTYMVSIQTEDGAVQTEKLVVF
ncbi:T9SS type A sorting domain-containing protein, partial [Arthrospira platensis SPKY1]|nr:T9SS type A sorting domain-containing protein [Arthrospira platensis SPKY1]